MGKGTCQEVTYGLRGIKLCSEHIKFETPINYVMEISSRQQVI